MAVRYCHSKWREPNSARIEEPPEAHDQFLIAPLKETERGKVGEGEHSQVILHCLHMHIHAYAHTRTHCTHTHTAHTHTQRHYLGDSRLRVDNSIRDATW